MIEFAIVSPIFLMMVFAILEFGLAYRDSLSINDAVNDAARTGAIQGPQLGAVDDDPPPIPPAVATSIPLATGDFVTIKRLRQGLAAIPVDWIDRIVIFHAQDPTSGGAAAQLSEACKTGGSTSGSGAPADSDVSSGYIGACNVYDPEEAFRAYEAKDVAFFNCQLDAGSDECGWPHQVRSNRPLNPIGFPDWPGPDYLGVWVKLDRPYLTGLFGKSLTLDDAAIVRLEPGIVDE